jgi:hypothetical protein
MDVIHNDTLFTFIKYSFAECHYIDCRCAECCGTILKCSYRNQIFILKPINVIKAFFDGIQVLTE